MNARTKMLLSCAVAAAWLIAAGPLQTAHSEDAWGQPTRYAAIAINDTSGAFGYAYNYRTRAEAERAALRRAGHGSRIVLSTTKPFFALARAPLGGWGVGAGKTPKAAKQAALKAARKYSICPEIRFCEFNGARY